MNRTHIPTTESNQTKGSAQGPLVFGNISMGAFEANGNSLNVSSGPAALHKSTRSGDCVVQGTGKLRNFKAQVDLPTAAILY